MADGRAKDRKFMARIARIVSKLIPKDKWPESMLTDLSKYTAATGNVDFEGGGSSEGSPETLRTTDQNDDSSEEATNDSEDGGTTSSSSDLSQSTDQVPSSSSATGSSSDDSVSTHTSSSSSTSAANVLSHSSDDSASAQEASSPTSAVQRFVQSTIRKGVKGLVKEYEEWDEDESAERHEDCGQIRYSVYPDWSAVWKHQAQFVLYIGECKEVRWFAPEEGQSKEGRGFRIHCTQHRKTGPIDFKTFTIVKTNKRTISMNKRTIGVLHWKPWKADMSPSAEQLTTLIEQLHLSGQRGLVWGDPNKTGPLLTFRLAETAMARLRAGCELTGGLRGLMDKEIEKEEYLYVHRELLQQFKTDANEAQVREFCKDYRGYLEANRVRVHTFISWPNQWTGRTTRRTLDRMQFTCRFAHVDDPSFNCECDMLNELAEIQCPKMEGGLVCIFLHGDIEMRDGQAVVVTGPEQNECTASNCIRLSTIVDALHRRDDCHVLIACMNAKPELIQGDQLASLGTSRVALLYACPVPREPTEEEDWDRPIDYEEHDSESREEEEGEEDIEHDIRRMILQALGKYQDPREAMADLDEDVHLKADMDKMWMEEGLGSSTTRSKASREPSSILPSASDFRSLLESTRSPDAEIRLEAEARMRRVDGCEKADLLRDLIKSDAHGEMRCIAAARLYSLMGCCMKRWTDRSRALLVEELMHAAREETDATLCEPLARALIRIGWALTEHGASQLLEFIFKSASSKSLVYKEIAVRLAASDFVIIPCNLRLESKAKNRLDKFWKKMINDEATRPQALKIWSAAVIDYHQRDWKESEVVDRLWGPLTKIIKLCKLDPSTDEESPLWTLVQVACGAPHFMDSQYLEVFLKAALRESDNKRLADLVQCISNQLHPDSQVLYNGAHHWRDLLPICSPDAFAGICIDRGIITTHLLTMFSWEGDTYTFDKQALCTLLRMIEQALIQPELQTTACIAFTTLIAKTTPEQCPMERVDRIVNKMIELAPERASAKRRLCRLAEKAPWAVQRHFDDALLSAAKIDESRDCGTIEFLIEHVLIKLKDTESLRQCFLHSSEAVLAAAGHAVYWAADTSNEAVDFFIQNLIELAGRGIYEAVWCLRQLAESDPHLFEDRQSAVKQILDEFAPSEHSELESDESSSSLSSEELSKRDPRRDHFASPAQSDRETDDE